MKHKRLLFGTFYRPPSADSIHHSLIWRFNPSCYRYRNITGDFNFNILSEPTRGKIVSTISQQFSLTQHITEPRRGRGTPCIVYGTRAAEIVPTVQVIYTSIGQDFFSNIHVYPYIQSSAVLCLTTWPLSLQVILLFSDKNHFIIIQYLTVLIIFNTKLLHLNGNKDHFLLYSMMVCTFIGILFPYSSVHS